MTKWILVVLFLVAPAHEEEAIKKVSSEWAVTFSAGDAKGVAALYAEDGDHVDPTGMGATGRAEIEKMMEQGLSGAFKGVKIEITPIRVRMLKPDVALVDGAWSLTGGRIPPSLTKGLYTMVMVKSRGKWSIGASRPMIPVTAPTPQSAKK